MRQNGRGCSPSSHTPSGHFSTHSSSIASPAWYCSFSACRRSSSFSASTYRNDEAAAAARVGSGRCQDSLQVRRVEEALLRDHPFAGHEHPVGLLLVAAQGGAQPHLLVRRREELR